MSVRTALEPVGDLVRDMLAFAARRIMVTEIEPWTGDIRNQRRVGRRAAIDEPLKLARITDNPALGAARRCILIRP